MTQIKVGDRVDAYDLRDGALIEQNRKVLKIETHEIPTLINGAMGNVPKEFALLEGCGYWIPLRCVRPAIAHHYGRRLDA